MNEAIRPARVVMWRVIAAGLTVGGAAGVGGCDLAEVKAAVGLVKPEELIESCLQAARAARDFTGEPDGLVEPMARWARAILAKDRCEAATRTLKVAGRSDLAAPTGILAAQFADVAKTIADLFVKEVPERPRGKKSSR